MLFPHPPVARLCSIAVLLAFAAGVPAESPRVKATERPKKMWIYIGTYTGPKSKGIYRLELDPATGKLTPAGLAAEVNSPSFLAVHPSRRFLYAVSEDASFGGKK